MTSLVGVKLSSTEWERRTARMEAHALDEGQSAIGEVYEAAPVPRMVSHAPRGEGLYYLREPGGPIRVVDVYRRGSAWFASWSDIPEFDVATSGYEFSDRPLVEPV